MMREIETWLSDSRVGDHLWLSTEADSQSSLHCVTVSTDVMSDHRNGIIRIFCSVKRCRGGIELGISRVSKSGIAQR